MSGNTTISARGTVVIDESELAELDELSLTSVVRQVADPVETLQSRHNDEARNSPTASRDAQSADSSINELLDRVAPTAESLMETEHTYPQGSSSDGQLPDGEDDELLSADVLFPMGKED